MDKKNFTKELDKINSPVMNFITTKQEVKKDEIKPYLSQKEIDQMEIPEGFRINPAIIEKKSKKVALAIYPSLHKKLKETAKAKNISVNDYICRAIQAYLENY